MSGRKISCPANKYFINMNKFYFLLIVSKSIFLSATFAQDQKFELFIGANESFRKLEYTGTGSPPMVEGDTKVQALNFGLRYRILNSRYCGFKSGLDLNAYGFMDRKITGVRWPSEITPQGYVFDPKLPHELHNGRKWIYLELPLVLEFKKSFGKWTPNIQLEVVPQYLVAFKSISNTDLGKNSEIQSPPNEYDKFNFATGATIGTYYGLSSKVSIFINGFYRKQLLGIIDAPITAKLYAMGLNAGVTFDIN